MTVNRGLLVLALLVLGLSVPVPASADAQLYTWDQHSTEPETQGVDAGQVKKVTQLWFHYDSLVYAGNIGTYVNLTRIALANGDPVDVLIYSKSIPGKGYNGTTAPGWDAGPGCPLHGAAAVKFRGIADPAEWDLQQELTASTTITGTYRFDFIFGSPQGNKIKSVTRTFGIAAAKNVIARFKDQNGEFVAGANLNFQLPLVKQFPISDSSGTSTLALAPATYSQGVATAPGCNSLSGLTLTVSQSDPATVWYDVTFVRNVAAPGSKGGLTFTVRNGDDPAKPPVTGAVVKFTEAGTLRQGTTDGAGTATFPQVAPGTYDVYVTAAGFQGGAVKASSAAGLTQRYNVEVRAGSPPTSTKPTDETGSQGFWESLFIPKTATLGAWSVWLGKASSWGPFGLVKDFFQTWNTGIRNSPGELCWAINVPLFGFGSGGLVGCIDLRRGLADNVTPYADGRRGSVFGSFLSDWRPMVGFAAWTLFLLAVFKWVLPRLQM